MCTADAATFIGGVCVVVRAKRDGKKKERQGIEPWPQGVGLGSGCGVRDRSDEEDDTQNRDRQI